ncbi:MAG: hypothetical protein AAFQ37_03505 [Bacteroidota bacterium]
MNTNELGFDEVVDTLGDSIEIYRTIKQPLQDGLDFTDLLAVYDAYPLAIEVYNDRNTFLSQLLDLSADEASQVLDRLTERTGIPRDNVEQIAFQSFSIASRTYRLIDNTIRETRAIIDEVRLVVGLDNGLPGAVLTPLPA